VCVALYSVRNMAFAMIACAAPIAFHVDLALRRRPAETRAEPTMPARPDPAPRAAPGAQAIALAAAVVLSISGGLFSSRLPDFTGFPVGAIDFMQEHGLVGRILDHLTWGSFIIWHQPGSKVFIDGRFEMIYPLAVQRDYIEFLRRGKGATRVLASYPHDFVMVEMDSPQYRFMTAQNEWRLIYRDPVAALFARADSTTAHLAGVPILRDKAPASFFP
jgi:hypothetical protein